MWSDLSDGRRSGHARPSAGSLTNFVSYPSHLARVPSCLPRVHLLHGRHTPLPFVRPQSTDAVSSHMPPPRDTKKGMPLSCLESPPIKEKTIKTRYEIKGNKKKKPRYTQPLTETPRKMPEIYTKRIATLTAHNTLKSLPPGQPRWGRQLIKEEATSPQRRPAATRGTAGVAVRRRYRRGSGRTRGR